MPGDPRRLGAEAELDPGAPMRRGEEMRGRHRDDAAHHPVGQLDDMDVLAVGARDGGEFEADEAGADHHDPVGGGEPLAQLVGLGQRAQIAHAVELDARQWRHPVARAGGEHEMAVGEALAGSEQQPLAGAGRSRSPGRRSGHRCDGRGRTPPAASAAGRGRSCRRDSPSTAAAAGRAAPARRRSGRCALRSRAGAARRPAGSRHGWRRR